MAQRPTKDAILDLVGLGSGEAEAAGIPDLLRMSKGALGELFTVLRKGAQGKANMAGGLAPKPFVEQLLMKYGKPVIGAQQAAGLMKQRFTPGQLERLIEPASGIKSKLLDPTTESSRGAFWPNSKLIEEYPGEIGGGSINDATIHSLYTKLHEIMHLQSYNNPKVQLLRTEMWNDSKMSQRAADYLRQLFPRADNETISYLSDPEELIARAGAHGLATKIGSPMTSGRTLKGYTSSWPSEYQPEFNEIIRLILGK